MPLANVPDLLNRVSGSCAFSIRKEECGSLSHRTSAEHSKLSFRKGPDNVCFESQTMDSSYLLTFYGLLCTYHSNFSFLLTIIPSHVSCLGPCNNSSLETSCQIDIIGDFRTLRPTSTCPHRITTTGQRSIYWALSPLKKPKPHSKNHDICNRPILFYP